MMAMHGSFDPAGFPVAVFELDGDVFELETNRYPTRDGGQLANHAAVHRVLVALSQHDGRMLAAIALLGLGRDDVELALRTGVLVVVHRARTCSPLDPVEFVDLGSLSSS